MPELKEWIGHRTDGTKATMSLERSIDVNLKVDVHDILEIDSQKEVFRAILLVKMSWVDPLLKNFISTIQYFDADGRVRELEGVIRERECDYLEFWPQTESGPLLIAPWHVTYESQPNWKRLFFPKHSFLNQVGLSEDLLEPSLEFRHCEEEGGVVWYRAKFVGTFHESMELQSFPFDRQLMRIKISAESPIEKFTFHTSGAGGFANRNLSVEWTIDKDMQDNCTTYVEPLRSEMWETDRQLCNAVVVIHVDRQSAFYLMNVYLTAFLLVLVSFASFRVALDDIGDRAAIQAAFLLIMVSYKHLISAWIPRTEYLTAMDWYIILAMLLIFIVIIESMAFHILCYGMKVSDEKESSVGESSAECLEDLETVDTWMGVGLFLLWVLGNLIFLAWYVQYQCGGHRRSWREVYEDNDIQRLPNSVRDLLGMDTLYNFNKEADGGRGKHTIRKGKLVQKPWSRDENQVHNENSIKGVRDDVADILSRMRRSTLIRHITPMNLEDDYAPLK